jgi:hypothetical protein
VKPISRISDRPAGCEKSNEKGDEQERLPASNHRATHGFGMEIVDRHADVMRGGCTGKPSAEDAYFLPVRPALRRRLSWYFPAGRSIGQTLVACLPEVGPGIDNDLMIVHSSGSWRASGQRRTVAETVTRTTPADRPIRTIKAASDGP